jgi:DNA-binding winged helix-turn-helix (wHTH) protein
MAMIRTGELVVDLNARFVSVGDNPLHLTSKEYSVLELLCLHKGSTVTKRMILHHLYGGMNEPELKIIDHYVAKLRKKLVQAIGGQHYIETVWGLGYALRDPPDPSVEQAPTEQWTVRRKATLVAAVKSGEITIEEALRRHQLSEEEFRAWQRFYEAYGLPGLRVTRLQQYRDPLRFRTRSRP